LVIAVCLSLIGCAAIENTRRTHREFIKMQQESSERIRNYKPPDRRLEIGMTEQEILFSWREPTRRHISSDGREMWVYRVLHLKCTYIFFRGGKVVSWKIVR